MVILVKVTQQTGWFPLYFWQLNKELSIFWILKLEQKLGWQIEKFESMIKFIIELDQGQIIFLTTT